MDRQHTCQHATGRAASNSPDEYMRNDTAPSVSRRTLGAVCRVLPFSSSSEPGAQPRGERTTMYLVAATSAVERGSMAMEAGMRCKQNTDTSTGTERVAKIEDEKHRSELGLMDEARCEQQYA